MSLKNQIDQLASEFAARVVQAIGRASMQELMAVMGEPKPRRGGRPKGSKNKPKVAEQSKEETKPPRRKRQAASE